jgi:hypothetical protein
LVTALPSPLGVERSGGAALLDCRHRLELTQAQVSGLLPAPRGPVVSEDVRDLQRLAI